MMPFVHRNHGGGSHFEHQLSPPFQLMPAITMFAIFAGVLMYATIYIYVQRDPTTVSLGLPAISMIQLQQQQQQQVQAQQQSSPAHYRQDEQYSSVDFASNQLDDASIITFDLSHSIERDQVSAERQRIATSTSRRRHSPPKVTHRKSSPHDVSDSLTDHVRLLAFKARHRLEIVKLRAATWLKEIFVALNQTVICHPQQRQQQSQSSGEWNLLRDRITIGIGRLRANQQRRNNRPIRSPIPLTAACQLVLLLDSSSSDSFDSIASSNNNNDDDDNDSDDDRRDMDTFGHRTNRRISIAAPNPEPKSISTSSSTPFPSSTISSVISTVVIVNPRFEQIETLTRDRARMCGLAEAVDRMASYAAHHNPFTLPCATMNNNNNNNLHRQDMATSETMTNDTIDGYNRSNASTSADARRAYRVDGATADDTFMMTIAIVSDNPLRAFALDRIPPRYRWLYKGWRGKNRHRFDDMHHHHHHHHHRRRRLKNLRFEDEILATITRATILISVADRIVTESSAVPIDQAINRNLKYRKHTKNTATPTTTSTSSEMSSQKPIVSENRTFALIRFTIRITNSRRSQTTYDDFAITRIETIDDRADPRRYCDTIARLLLAYPRRHASTLARLNRRLDRLLDADEIGIVGIRCHESHRVCLSRADMRHIAETAVQAESNGRRRSQSLLYPVDARRDVIYRLGALFDDLLIRLEATRQSRIAADWFDSRMQSSDDDDNDDDDAVRKSKTSPPMFDREPQFDFRTERLHSMMTMIDFGDSTDSDNYNVDYDNGIVDDDDDDEDDEGDVEPIVGGERNRWRSLFEHSNPPIRADIGRNEFSDLTNLNWADYRSNRPYDYDYDDIYDDDYDDDDDDDDEAQKEKHAEEGVNEIDDKIEDEYEIDNHDNCKKINSSTICNCTKDLERYSHFSSFRIVSPADMRLVSSSVDGGSWHVVRGDDTSRLRRYAVDRTARYRELLVSIRVAAAHCDAWIVTDDRVIFQSGILNFTLGIGVNIITISLVGVAKRGGDDNHPHSGTKLHATSIITIRRMTRDEDNEKWSNEITQPHEQEPQKLITQKNMWQSPTTSTLTTCSLTQDCAMQIYGAEKCGLQPTTQEETKTKSDNNWCTDGAEPGRWLVPCGRCSDERTCRWRDASWTPYRCRYRFVESATYRARCFDRKHLLLLGDSTNRGMLHYLLERVNRSRLSDAPKTHDMRRFVLRFAPPDVATDQEHNNYNNVDGNNNNNNNNNNKINQSVQISATFAYYPKFWIPPERRPSFSDALRELLRKSGEDDGDFDSGANLILLVGGVQWIGKPHLVAIRREIKRFGLEKAKIIIKTMGSGFHQPVNGVHYVALPEQRKLAQQNKRLIEFAKELGMDVLDTYNKTIAMFRDFYPGKCACHFHNVVKADKRLTENGDRTNSPDQTQYYHVEGQLNRLYSEILISMICQSSSS